LSPKEKWPWCWAHGANDRLIFGQHRADQVVNISLINEQGHWYKPDIAKARALKVGGNAAHPQAITPL
jgi:hypothetical protein